MEDVSATATEPLPFPEVVAQFEQADCTVLGRLTDGGPPIAVLTTPDRHTLVAVDGLAGQPFIRLRSVLGNGDLVESVLGDRVPLNDPDAQRLATRDLHHAAPGRQVELATHWDARGSLNRHAAYLAARAGKRKSTPETLDSMAEALLVWEAAARHDTLADAHGERIAVNTSTWLLAGSILGSMLIALVLVVSAVPSALLIAVVTGGLLIGTSLLAGTRVTRWLFGVRRLRPRFTLT